MAMTHGNTKLGKLIWGWTLPALLTICIGASDVCRRLCYALKGFFLMGTVKESHKRNYEESLGDDFVQRMNTDIRRNFAQVVRVHVGGDFYSVEYIHKWIKVVRANPAVLFYAYTRSWRDPEFLVHLSQLGMEPNFHMWWSCDRETGEPTASRFAKTAYLMENDDDLPPYKVDLVFRDKATAVLKYTPEGSLVCPYDNGITETTCSQCKICFRDEVVPRKGRKNERAISL
tara:strand:+ start:3160 stop:3849 length:690 start_codon:yes stop_codon:yes gene_type:complete